MSGANWYCICWDLPGDPLSHRTQNRQLQEPRIMQAYTAEDAVTQFRIEKARDGLGAQILSIGPATIQQIVRWHQDRGEPLP